MSDVERVIDLALTKDGRKSFKKRGKWRHGFIPVDQEARVAKAKGSPIAKKRIDRLYGKLAGRKSKVLEPSKEIKNARGGTERVGRAANLRAPEVGATRESQRVADPQIAGKQVRRRSSKKWEEIPDTQKVTRNGKRYVLTTFQGKQQLTQWFGPTDNFVEKADTNRTRRITGVDTNRLQGLSTAQLRALLRVKGQSPEAKKRIRILMNKKYATNRSRA